MHRQTQGQAGFGAKSAYGVADWQALEIQLNRTRTILQEILVHLQEVLRNLKMARTGSRANAAAGAGADRFSSHENWRRAGSAQRPHAGGQGAAGKTAAGGTGSAGAGKAGAAASERTKAWNRPGFESRPGAGAGASARATAGAGTSSRTTAGAGASFRATAGAGAYRSTAGPGASSRTASGAERPAGEEARASAGSQEKTRPGEGWSFKSGASRPGAGQAFRERAATGGAQRGATGAGAGNDRRETGQRPTAGATRGAAGFSMDEGRQARAREVARRGGMNLKCAYDILCLDYPCSVDEIKVAYRHMARRFHPDLGGDEEAMKDVNVAYEMAMRFSAGPRRASAAWAV